MHHSKITCMQDYPVGLPKCVVPTDDKLDIPSLKSDIPKFRPWLSVEAWEDWERFLKSTLPALDCNDGEPQDVDQSFINVFETANDGMLLVHYMHQYCLGSISFQIL